MGFVEAIKVCLRKYANFSGRARRPEYWWFVLFVALATLVATLIDVAIWGTAETAVRILGPIVQLALMLPLFAVGWRRLHDSGRPGWYLLLPMLLGIATALALLLGVAVFGSMEAHGVPSEELRGPAGVLGSVSMVLVGILQLVLTLLMLWWLTRPTDPQPNRFGPPPPA
ncbi:DUF805 domain-containing protein [Salipiger pacificus]|nr:DUF805 domain-containing protein [Alloyangia pacifica]